MSAIDIIVPCYRYGHYLRDCVESVLAQDFDDLRVLIMDDASPDNTAEVAAALAELDCRVQVISHESNRGHIATYNEGIEQATADHLMILSADDMLTPGALSRAAAPLDADASLAFVYGQALVRRADGSEELSAVPHIYTDREVVSGPAFIRALGGRNHVHTPTVLVRRQAQIAAGGYRPELPHAGDMEMWLRLAAHGSVGFVAQPQAIYRFHGANMTHEYTNSCLPDLEQRCEAIDRFFIDHGATLTGGGRLHRHARRCLAAEALVLASLAFNRGDLAMCYRLNAYSSTCAWSSRLRAARLRLLVKQAFGPRVWAHLLPLVARWHTRSCILAQESGPPGRRR